MVKKLATVATPQPTLEEQFRTLFSANAPQGQQDAMRTDLRQPSPLQIVHTVVTYGGYEDPI